MTASGTEGTTTTLTHPGLGVSRGAWSPAYRNTGWRILRSEWIRLVSVRANLWTLTAMGVLMVGIGLVAAATSTGSVRAVGPGGGSAPGMSGSDPMTTVLAGQTPVLLVIGVFGVLVGAREYGSGLIRTTLAAVPRRLPVLAARAAVFVASTAPVLLLTTAAAYVGGSAILRSAGDPYPRWADAGVPRAVIGTALYLVGIGVLGLCLGMLTRSIGQGIGWLVGLVLVVPGFGSLLLPDDWSGILDYLPSNAGASLAALTEPTNGLGVVAGGVVFTAWVVTGLAATAAALRVRDV